MATIQNIPKLRFPRFNEEWEVNKLNKFASINPKNSSLPESFVYIDLESVTDGHLIKNNVISKNEAPSRAQRILKEKDILYQTVRPYQKNNLYFNKIGDYVASTGYAQIRTKNDSQFLFHFLHTEKFVANVMLRCTGTSYPAINSTDLSSIEISFPTLPEQQKIASFLCAVDEKIQQLSRKKELLEQYKKGVMQQLFSGKLRFKDENGNDYANWESVKMNELFSFKQGIQCGIEDQFLEKSDNMERFIRIIDLTSDKEIPRFIKNTDKGNLIFEDDLFMVRYGVPGLIGYGYNGVIANNLFRLIPKKSVHNKFYLYVLTHLKKDIMNLSSSTTMPALNFSSLGVLKIPEIEIEEQQKIATFLSSIDVKIENTHQEINQMQSFKKGLLQQMFV